MRTSTSASLFPCCRRVQAIKGHSYHVEQSLPPTRQALLNTGRVDDAFDWLVSMMAPEAWDRACSRSPPGCKASEVSQEMRGRPPALARKFSFCIRTILQVDRGDVAVMPCFANKQPQRRRRAGERMFKMWNAEGVAKFVQIFGPTPKSPERAGLGSPPVTLPGERGLFFVLRSMVRPM